MTKSHRPSDRKSFDAGSPSAPRPAAEGGDLLLSRLAVGAILVLLAILALRQVASPDVGFHLKAGERIVSGEGWPRSDPFTFTVRDHAYIDTSWGYQVLATLSHRAAGAPGLVLLHAALVLAIFGVLLRTVRLGPRGPLVVPLALLVGGLASEMRFEVRPELVSYLLLAVVLHVLHRHAEGRPSPLWAIPAIHLAWANLHGLFVLGWIAEGCFVAGLLLRDRQLDRKLLAWSAASVVATVVNPYGWRGMLVPLELATRLRAENPFAQSIGEFVSPFALGLSEKFPFYPRVPVFAFRAFAVLSLVALVPLLKRKRFWNGLLWLAFMALASRMIRNVPLLVVACLPPTVWGLTAAAERRGRAPGGRAVPRLRRVVAVGLAAASLVTAARVVHDAYYIESRRTDRFGLGWNRLALPLDTAEFAKRSGLRGPVLNHLNFGGWLIWALPDPVFIDGRLEVMGEAFYEEYRRALGSTDAMEACVARYGIRWAVFPYAITPDLLGRMSRDPGWSLAHVDAVGVIFTRREPGGGAEIRGAAPPPAAWDMPVRDLPGIGSTPREGRLARWLMGIARTEEFPWEDYQLGLFHLFRTEPEAAAARFSRAIVRSRGAYYEIYNNLAAALWRMKRTEEARACYEVVLRDDPGNRIARERLH